MIYLTTTIEYIGYAILFLLFGVLFILLSPIMAAVMIYAIISDRKLDKESAEYLQTLEGSSWFYYTNRQSSQALIEQQILPLLPSSIEIAHFRGSKLTLPKGFNHELLSRAIHNHHTPAPGIMTVNNGELQQISLHADLYHPVGGTRSLEPLAFATIVKTKLKQLQNNT